MMDEAVAHTDGRPVASRMIQCPVLSEAFQGFGSISSPEMSETGLTVPDMNEPLSRYNVTVTVGCDGGSRTDPAAFAVAADQAAWRRSASIISAHLADKIISVVTVAAPDRYAAVAVLGPSCPARSSVMPCHPATQQMTVPSIVPSPRPD